MKPGLLKEAHLQGGCLLSSAEFLAASADIVTYFGKFSNREN
jgi:hypothetical protein